MRSVGVLLGALITVLGTSGGARPVAAEPVGAARIGRWSRPFDVGVIGIHAVLLPAGEVLLFEYPADSPGSEAHVINPATGENRDVSLEFRRNIFCSGHSLMPDGRVLVTGGEQYDGSPPFAGIRGTTIFDPATRGWTKAASMFKPRWYPTNIQMPEGTTLVLSGLGSDGETLMRRMERFDPRSGEYTLLPHSADSDSDLYPRMFVLSNGDVFRAGPNAEGMLFHPATNRWSFVDTMRDGWRGAGGAVLLANQVKPPSRILASGGGGPKASAEIIDLAEPSPRWAFTDDMNHARYNHNLVLLADATVLAVGGGQGPDQHDSPVRQAELYDPGAGRWTLMASQTAARTYHSTALLLPDGRVLSAGDDGGDLPRTVEYYSPPYLFRGARPRITSAPGVVTYGQVFTIETPDATDISRVAMVRLGSATHATGFDQRYVDLGFTRGEGEIMARAPGSANLAPPGHYMLFILNSTGVPATAKILRLGKG